MLKELKQRLRSETPLWFKRIRKVSLSLSGTAIALLTLSATVNSFVLPAILQTACTWVVIAGTSMGVVSSTAKKDVKNDDNEKDV